MAFECKPPSSQNRNTAALRLLSHTLLPSTKTAMSSYQGSMYGSSVVVVQAGNRSSTVYSGGASSSRSSVYTTSSASSRSAFSMDSSVSSRFTVERRFRTGTAGEFVVENLATAYPGTKQRLRHTEDGYHTSVKEVANTGGRPDTVIVHHKQANPDHDEPRASDYQSHRDSYSSKANSRR